LPAGDAEHPVFFNQARVRHIVEIALLKEVRKMASVLFSPIALRGLTLPNRVVVSPMCQYNSNNGSANDWHLMHLGSFSLGCAGLVMCEMTNVNPIGRISPKCAGMYSDDNETALKRVHDFCRTYGVAKLGVQLAHAGRKAPTTPPAAGGKPILTKEEGGWVPEAPSAIPYDTGWPVPHAMTKDDIKRCVGDFAAAAKRVDHIGYDDRVARRPRLSAAPIHVADIE
jgi:2,4-dienoyl-CoA reductase-like NADH-dependent reductase (Old Yellow Enzyme family)